jgi:phage shock protein PspC (stress-responsive transcriptional regulator)
VLAGVAGGLGEYTGVDPVVFRVLFAVLTLFGGAGLLLYLVGWLFLPDEGQQFSSAESLIGRGRSGSSATEAALLAAAALILAILLIRGDFGDLALLALVVAGLALIVRNLDERRRGEPAPSRTAPPYPPPYPPSGYSPGYPPGYPPAHPEPYGTAQPAGPAWTGAGGGTDALATGSTATDVLPPYPGGYPPAPPLPARPRRERSTLGRLTLSAMLLALGVLGLLGVLDVVEPAARHYLAVAVAVLGAGLLAGAWVGRARWLIALGIPLTIVLVAVSTAQDVFGGGGGVRMVHPITSADLQPRYQVGTGILEMDLSDVDFTERKLDTELHVGLGNVKVIVPRNVDVTVYATAGLGSLDLFGTTYDGGGIDRQLSDDGPDGAGGGDLDLTIDLGLGHAEVHRAAS